MQYIRTDKGKYFTNSRMFYDSLGLISLIMLSIKIILQKLFELKFEWDTYIDKDTSQLRKKYIKVFKHVSSSVKWSVLAHPRSKPNKIIFQTKTSGPF